MCASRHLKLACGCFVFAKREAFEKCGGFDETLFAAEEWAVSRRLARVGRFVVLKQQVITSARKLRTHSAWEILSLLGKVALFGPRYLRKREGLELWYGERRVER
jgi:GT2 family glycosyltransferase